MISAAQLALVMPAAKLAGRIELWAPSLTAAMLEHDITTDARIAMFVATIAEETGELQAQTENLHYSGDRLRQIFPGMFARNPGMADDLAAAGPESIANYIYADANRPAGYRMGNTQPGDGWKYRGRGPMQLTGRGNYERFYDSLGMPRDTDPDWIITPEGGSKSAAHFWQANGCNERADADDFEGATKLVNGGTLNMDKRQMYYDRAKAALQA